MIDCDPGMILALLRNWHPNRLLKGRFQHGIRLASLRPELLKKQEYCCAWEDCFKKEVLLVNDGERTHVDHKKSVKAFLNKVLQGEMPFDQAYGELWDISNLRALHRECNYALKKKDTSDILLIED